MRKTRLTQIGSTAFAIKFGSRSDGGFSGTFITPSSATPRCFESLSGLVLMIDEELDVELDGATQVVRSKFDADVELEVLFRQHYSWQGRLRLLQQGREATFRSVLELLVIMETVFGE